MVTLLTSLVCVYYASFGIFEKNRERLEAIDSIALYDPFDRYDIYPELMIRLTGRRWLPKASHYSSLVVDLRQTTPDERQLLAKEMKSLQYLLAAKITAMDATMGWSLKHFVNAKELTLIGPTLDPRQWESIQQLKNLKILRVVSLVGEERVRLGPEFFGSINQLPNLTHLDLERCDYSSEDVFPLANNETLERIGLVGCSLDETIVETVISIDSLRIFSAPSGLSDEQMNHLSTARPNLLIIR